MKIKEPKKLLAIVFIIYTIWAIDVIVEQSHKPTFEKLTGLTSTGTVSISILSQCNIALKDGYNLFSACVNITNSSIRKVLENINGKYDFVLQLNTTSQRFLSFSPDAETNEFDTISQNLSYFIFMRENATLSIVGSQVGDLDVALTQETNAVAYPYIFSANVSRYILPLRENVSFVLKWNVTSQDVIIFSPEAEMNDFETIDRGEGQFIYLGTASSVLRYNKSALNGS